MDKGMAHVFSRTQVAVAVFLLWRQVCSEDRLNRIFDSCRGDSYEKVLTFPSLVQLVFDAITEHEGSGLASIENAIEHGRIQVSKQAAFGKLRRVPKALSQGLLRECAAALRELTPDSRPVEPGPSLRGFEIVVLDGKVLKHLAKRLKVARGKSGKLLGGKSLVALHLQTQQAIAMECALDGESNECRLVPGILNQVRPLLDGPRLWVADAQYCDLTQPPRFLKDGDAFLVRYHPKVAFTPDAGEPGRGIDDRGRPYVDETGWLGKPDADGSLRVRRIRVTRADAEDFIVVTSLRDRSQYSAVDLLQLYDRRWNIETVFQHVTGVLHLRHVIGSTAQASLFQLSLCLLLSNLLQTVLGIASEETSRPVESFSVVRVFRQFHREVVALSVLLSVSDVLELLDHVCESPRELIIASVSSKWNKSPKQARSPPAEKEPLPGGHTSIHRLQNP